MPAHVEIGHVVPLQHKNNIFWIFKTTISRNCGKWMATCGMSGETLITHFLFFIKLGCKECLIEKK
ncbi:MAG: hypothetical protein U9N36_06910, partial [Euryarchaeota archaeon]|nr:hypothetical protein [Euryarchaeota archaeon]